MGVYDTVEVPCPKCGKIYHAQSKSGPCYMNTYSLEPGHCPANVMEDVNRHAPFECECGAKFEVKFKTAVVSALSVVVEEHDEG